MTARLASSVLVGGLIRRAESLGGFAAVLAKGDATAGAVVVILVEKGGKPQILERILQPNGEYRWLDTSSQDIGNVGQVSEFVARRRRFDPDLWIIELDVSDAERFAAEMNSLC